MSRLLLSRWLNGTSRPTQPHLVPHLTLCMVFAGWFHLAGMCGECPALCEHSGTHWQVCGGRQLALQKIDFGLETSMACTSKSFLVSLAFQKSSWFSTHSLASWWTIHITWLHYAIGCNLAWSRWTGPPMGCRWDANFPWPNLWFWQAYPWSQRQSPYCTPFLGACNQIMSLRMQISAEWVKIEGRWGTWIWPPVHAKWAMSSFASIRRGAPLHSSTYICFSDVQASSTVPFGPDCSTITSAMAAGSDSGTPPNPLLGMDRNWPYGEPQGLPDPVGEPCQIILDHFDNVPASAAPCSNWRWRMHHGYPGEHPNNGSWAGKGGESTMWMGLLCCDQGQRPETSSSNALACWHHLHDWAPQMCPGFTGSSNGTNLLWRTWWNGLLLRWQAHLGLHEGNEGACPAFPSKSMPSLALSFSSFSISVWHPFVRGG